MTFPQLDHRVSLAIHSATRSREWLHTAAAVFARWVFWALLIGMALIVYFKQEPLYVTQLAKVLMLSIAFGFIGNLWFSKMLHRKRPFVTHRLHALIPTAWLGPSFPSDHAMLSFAIATPLFVVEPATGAIALVMAAGIGFSRVAVGVHYVSDVVLGSAVGVIATALAVFFVTF